MTTATETSRIQSPRAAAPHPGEVLATCRCACRRTSYPLLLSCFPAAATMHDYLNALQHLFGLCSH
jgi:hypothetical protein